MANAPGAKKSGRKLVPFLVKGVLAREVAVTGDFTGWSLDGIRMSPEPIGEWRAVLELEPGEHQYRLIVDGEWRDDVAAKRRVPNPFGSENGVLQVA